MSYEVIRFDDLNREEIAKYSKELRAEYPTWYPEVVHFYAKGMVRYRKEVLEPREKKK